MFSESHISDRLGAVSSLFLDSRVAKQAKKKITELDLCAWREKKTKSISS